MAYSQNNVGLGNVATGAFSFREFGSGAAVFGGVVLCLAAVGLWFDPRAMASPETIIIRSGLTCLFIGIGFSLFNHGNDRSSEEIQLDLEAGVLRHAMRGTDGIARLKHSYSLADLRSITVADDHLVAVSLQGREVLRVPVAMAIPQAELDRMIAPFQRTTL